MSFQIKSENQITITTMQFIGEDYLLLLIRLVHEHEHRVSSDVRYYPENFKASGYTDYPNKSEHLIDNLIRSGNDFGVRIFDIDCSLHTKRQLSEIASRDPGLPQPKTELIKKLSSDQKLNDNQDLLILSELLKKHSIEDDSVRFSFSMDSESFEKVTKFISEYVDAYMHDQLVEKSGNYVRYEYIRDGILKKLSELNFKHGKNFVIGVNTLFDESICPRKEFHFLEIVLALEHDGFIRIDEITCLGFWEVSHEVCNFRITLLAERILGQTKNENTETCVKRFHFVDGVLFRDHSLSVIVVKSEDSLEYRLLNAALSSAVGEKMDGATDSLEMQGRQVPDTARTLNKKINETFEIPNFFEIDYPNKSAKRLVE